MDALARPLPAPDPLVAAAGRHARLWRAFAVIAVLAVAFAGVQLVAAVVLRDPYIGALAGIVMAIAVVGFGATALARRGRLDAAVDTAVAGILVTSVAWVAVMPAMDDIAGIAPILAVAVALPYRSGRSLAPIIVLAVLTTCVIAGVAELAPLPPTPEAYVTVLRLPVLTASVILALLALWHFSNRLDETVDGLTAAADALRIRDRAIASTVSGVAIVDVGQPGWPVVFVNPAFERITGYSAEEVIGTDGGMLVGPETDAATVAEHEATVREGRSGTVTILNYRKDGSTFWNELTVSPIREDDGTITHYVAYQVDVTDRHSLEEQLHAAHRMEAVGQLAGGVAHDFNNILTAISGYARIGRDELTALPDGPSVEALRLDLDEIARASDRAAGLTRQLLAFSRRQVLRPEVVAVGDVVRQLEPMLSHLLGEQFQLELALAPDLPTVRADPGQIEQVLVNLALNARDASPRGGRIRIATSGLLLGPDGSIVHDDFAGGGRAASYARLSVSDEGIGMSPEIQSRMFEPFFTTKDRGQGTGLGLATVDGIVAQSGGRITCDSEPGRGTTFHIDLPAHLPAIGVETANELSPARAVEAPESPRPPVGSLAEPRPAPTGTILVAEDEAAVRSLSAAILRRAGFAVIEADGGEAALAAARRHVGRIDLLLSDVVMPGLSGPELADRFRLTHPDAPIVFMSGYPDHVRRRVGGRTPEDILEKPFTAEGLVATVEARLRPRTRRRR
ncbi:MAG: ATP-binding protein [Chloroflexota bacterium]